MKVPSLTSNRSTKRSNLIRERPLRRMILDRREVIYVAWVLEPLEATGASVMYLRLCRRYMTIGQVEISFCPVLDTS
jgi:hypothetical protein